MKIAHISTSATGGAGIAALRLHSNLVNNSIDSNFIQTRIIENPDLINIYRATHFHNIEYRILNKLNLLSIFSQNERMMKKSKKYNEKFEKISLPFSYYNLHEHPIVKSADIIHLHWVADFLDYPSFFQHIKKPIIWTIHDMNPFLGIFHYESEMIENQYNDLKTLEIQIRILKKEILKKANNLTIVSPSQWLINKSKDYDTFDIVRDKLVIPNTMDKKDITKQLSKKDIGINNDNLSFFFIADYIDIKRKGFDLLKKALDNFKECPINLILLGSNIDKISFPDNDLINIIAFEKTYDRNLINNLYSVADYTLLPSREDNLPNVMLESFQNGTPVISFANGGMAEHINKDTGILIENDISENSLKNALKLAVKQNDYFDSKIIKKYYNETFSFDNTTQKYINLYESLL